MKQYEITHKGKKYVMMSIYGLMKTLIDFCTEEKINPNEVESCVLIPKKEPKSIKGLSETLITELNISCDQTSRVNQENYELTISFVSMSPKGSKNINKFFEKLLAKHHSKQ